MVYYCGNENIIKDINVVTYYISTLWVWLFIATIVNKIQTARKKNHQKYYLLL